MIQSGSSEVFASGERNPTLDAQGRMAAARPGSIGGTRARRRADATPMTLWAHRDTKAERLVAVLAEKLAASWPEDVLTPVTVIVGSRGMQRWLNHELATAHGSVAGVDFVLPGKGFQDATAEVFKAAGRETPDDDEGVWSGMGLHQRVVRGIRARLGDPSFERVRKYLGELDGPVGPRELAFTTEVASVVERLLYDRPDDTLKWMADPTASERDQEGTSDNPRWLATLLSDLQRGSGGVPEPATRLIELRKLRNQDLAPIPTPVFVFGLSSLRPGDKLYLAELARHMDIHLFMLVPSKRWWADIHSRKGERAALKQATSQKEISELLQAFEQANPMLAANGAPSRDLQIWLEDVGYQADEDIDPPAARTRLEVLQHWIDAAEPPAALGERLQEAALLEADESALPSIEINACHGPLRQCEALRDDLLRRFAADETLEPRHVLVTTSDLATYAPLIAAVFGREHKGESAVPAIPVHIADLGLTDTNPVAAVLLDVIGLVGARVTATTLLDLLGREPVRTKFRIEDEDLGALQDLVVSSGLRWAWDAEDRARHDQPAVDQNTVRFALERLALGVLMPDPGGFEVVPPGAGLGPAAPLDLPSRDQAVRFGTLAAVCHALQRLQHELTTPARSEVWRARLERVVETLCDVPEARAWQRSRVLSTLHDLLP
jgi:exodeoxyribonuclease V gamma subunit